MRYAHVGCTGATKALAYGASPRPGLLISCMHAGGAVYAEFVNMSIHGCVFMNNLHVENGAISASFGRTNITNTQFTGNIAESDKGGALHVRKESTWSVFLFGRRALISLVFPCYGVPEAQC